MRVSEGQMDLATLLLIDELKQKNSKSNKKQSKLLENILEPSIPKSMQLKPDWNRVPSKEVKMTDEEFEEAIRALAFINKGERYV
jgi:ribosome biogenesis GTPase A